MSLKIVRQRWEGYVPPPRWTLPFGSSETSFVLNGTAMPASAHGSVRVQEQPYMSPSLTSPERPSQQEPPPFGLFPIRHSQTSCTLPRHSQFGVYPTPHPRPVMPDRLHNTSVIEQHGAAPTSAPQSPLPVFPPAMSRLAACSNMVVRIVALVLGGLLLIPNFQFESPHWSRYL